MIGQHIATIDGIEMAYVAAGEGPPLVLIHGLSGSTRWWNRNIGPLAEHFRVYALDLAGFGRSRRGGRFVLSEAADQLARWMTHVGIESGYLVGHSMGGFISADLAARQPRRVARLVLVAAAIFPREHDPRQPYLGLARSFRYMPVRFLPLLATDALRAGPVTITDAAWQLLHPSASPDPRHVITPTLLIWGERDTVVPRDIGERLAGEMPNADLRLINGAGHNVMWDRPFDFNLLVTAFLDSTTLPESDEETNERKTNIPSCQHYQP